MKILKIVVLASILFLVGCENTTKTIYKNKPISKSEKILSKFDFYICKSIGVGKDYRSDIYGHNPKSNVYESIALNLGQMYGIVDDCVNDVEGNIYFTSRKNNAIYKIDRFGQKIMQIASGFDIAWGLAYDKKRDRLYLSNWHGNSKKQYGEIEYIDLKTLQRDVINLENNQTYPLKSGGKMVFDKNYENLYIADLFGEKIYKYNLTNSKLEEFTSLNAQPGSIDIYNNKLYISQYNIDFIITIDIDSKKRDVVIQSKDKTVNECMAIDKKRAKIYFGETKNNQQLGNSLILYIHSANLDGSNVEVIKSPLSDVNSKYYSEKYGLYGLQAVRVVEN